MSRPTQRSSVSNLSGISNPRSPANKYLDISFVTKTFPAPNNPGANTVVVEDFNLTIKRGEFVCLIGHSGCGKSTVLSIVAGLTEATAGGVILDGRALPGPGPDRGVVFQSPSLLPWRTALENVLLAVEQVTPKQSPKARRDAAASVLQAVGLGHALDSRPAELSAGMCQRVGIARAFALNPKVLLLDEPFGMLDALTRLELQQVLLDLWSEDAAEPKTALMVTHDVDEALFLADRIAMMTSGPAARLGGILDVPFPRPRERVSLMESPEYEALRDRLLAFLDGQSHQGSRGARTETGVGAREIQKYRVSTVHIEEGSDPCSA